MDLQHFDCHSFFLILVVFCFVFFFCACFCACFCFQSFCLLSSHWFKISFISLEKLKQNKTKQNKKTSLILFDKKKQWFYSNYSAANFFLKQPRQWTNHCTVATWMDMANHSILHSPTHPPSQPETNQSHLITTRLFRPPNP